MPHIASQLYGRKEKEKIFLLILRNLKDFLLQTFINN